MTLNADRGSSVLISDLVTAAYRLAGLLNEGQTATGAKAAAGRSTLDFIVNGLEAEGYSARGMVFDTIDCVPLQVGYPLPADTADVVGNASLVPGTSLTTTRHGGTGETIIQQISRESFQALTNKDATGRPIFYWVERTPDATTGFLTMYVYPLLDAGDYVIRFQKQQLRAVNSDGTYNIDFDRWFQEALRWELAHQLAFQNSLPMDRCAYLRGEARDRLERCKAASKQSMNQQMVVSHRTRWQR